MLGFGGDMLEESQVEFKKGDSIQSRFSGRTGRIIKLFVDQLHAIVKWDNGAEQKLTTGQLIKIDEPRYKAASDEKLVTAFDFALRTLVGDTIDAVEPHQFDKFGVLELLELGNILRKSCKLSLSPEWIRDELIRRGFRVG